MSQLRPYLVQDQKTVSLTAATTAATVVPVAAPQYEIYNDGSVTAFIRWNKTAANVATVPSGSTGGSYPLSPGNTKVITMDDPTSPYTFSGITSSSTAIIYITPGSGE